MLEVGVALFGSKPYDDVSMDEIAEAAAVSAPLIQHYFGGKQGFFLAVVEHAITRLETDAEPNLQRPLSDLRRHLEAYFRFVVEHPHAVTLEQHCPSSVRAAVQDLYDGYRERTAAQVQKTLKIERPSKVLKLALAVWVELNEALARKLVTETSSSPSVAAQLSEATLFALLKTAKAPVR